MRELSIFSDRLYLETPRILVNNVNESSNSYIDNNYSILNENSTSYMRNNISNLNNVNYLIIAVVILTEETIKNPKKIKRLHIEK